MKDYVELFWELKYPCANIAEIQGPKAENILPHQVQAEFDPLHILDQSRTFKNVG